MTEAHWLAATDPMSMLSFLKEKTSARKLRLFAVACARQAGEQLTDERGRVAIATAERFADGMATPEELAACYRPARRIAIEWGREHPDEPFPYQLIAPADAAVRCPFDAAHTGALDAGWTTGADRQWGSVAYARLAELVRDVFGNPFRPVTADPAWLTPTAVTLARQMYESRDFALMPVLADALQDAGCDRTDILDHWRGAGPHVRGCWVIDLLLGKA